MTYDCIIIGSGVGGITAACLLVKKGYSVLLLEKNSQVGGNASCFYQDGLRFEYAVHQVSGMMNIYHIGYILKEIGVFERINAIKIEDFISIVYPEKRFYIRDNLDSLLENLNRVKPHRENERYVNFLKDVVTFIHHYGWLDSKFGIEAPDFPFRMIFTGIPSIYKFLQSFNKASKEFFDKYFPEIADNDIAYFLSPYFGVSPKTQSALVNIGGTASYLSGGSYYPQGGTENFISIFIEKFKDFGGSYKTNNEVKKIIKKDRLFEVVTIGKDSYQTKSVIYAASPVDLFSKVLKLDNPSQEVKNYITNLYKLEPSISVVRIFCTVDGTVEDFNEVGYETFIYNTDNLESYFDAVSKGDISGMSLLLPFKIDKDNRTYEKLPVIITMLFPYILNSEFEKIKNSIIDRSFSIINRFYPQFSSLRLIKILSPEDLYRRTFTVNGAMYGWSCTPQQAFFNRLSNCTPVDGVFLCGHFTRPMHGISGVIRSGYITSRIVDKYLSRLFKK